jgi:hypothetical protein
MTRDHIPRRLDLDFWQWNESGLQAALDPEGPMIILIPFKPFVLVLGLLSGLILVGFVGSSLLEGKEPFVMNRAQARHTLIKQNSALSNSGTQGT